MEETNSAVVEIRAVETFAELLYAVHTDGDGTVFYNQLCEAICRISSMNRAAVCVYDEAMRRVHVVGSHGIAIDAFRDFHFDLDSAPMALTALSQDRVVEASSGPPLVIVQIRSKPPTSRPMMPMMQRKKVVGEISGQVTCQNFSQRLAPSIEAAS